MGVLVARTGYSRNKSGGHTLTFITARHVALICDEIADCAPAFL